jgi:predicted  nucleic acid-binding Zn-ribbon protein
MPSQRSRYETPFFPSFLPSPVDSSLCQSRINALEAEIRRLSAQVTELTIEKANLQQATSESTLQHLRGQTHQHTRLQQVEDDRVLLLRETALQQAQLTALRNDLAALANNIRALQVELQRSVQARHAVETELQRKSEQLRAVLQFVEEQIRAASSPWTLTPLRRDSLKTRSTRQRRR